MSRLLQASGNRSLETNGLPKQRKPEETARKESWRKVEGDGLTRADFIERLMIEAATKKRWHSNGDNQPSQRLDQLLHEENNDWIFEKILDKFDDLRSRKAQRHEQPSYDEFDAQPSYGVERIIERRYYIKKSQSIPKRDQITSTSDLRDTQRKYRQHSGVSRTSRESSCSQCSSSTPTYVEHLREQSDALRHEIGDLKSEIEHLQKYQQEFFQEFQDFFRAKTNSNGSKIIPGSRIVATKPPQTLPIPLTTTQKSRSVSTESQRSSPSTESSTPIPAYQPKNNAPASNTSARSTPSITEFTATKNPSIPPAPPFPPAQLNAKPAIPAGNSKSSSEASTPTNFKPPPAAPPSFPPQFNAKANAPVLNSNSSSAASTPVNSKPPPSFLPAQLNGKSFTPTANSKFSPIPRLANNTAGNSQPLASPLQSKPVSETSFPTNASITSVSTVQENPPMKPPPAARPPITEFTPARNSASSSGQPALVASKAPVGENPLAHRRVLSPRSQIIASSAPRPASSSSISSTSSSESSTLELHPLSSQPPSQAASRVLLPSELKDLGNYSSQLEVSGFPSAKPAAVDPIRRYVESVTRPLDKGRPPIPRASPGSQSNLANNRTRQLDKYNLEIKPLENLAPTAPFLMPPLDSP